MDSGFETLLNGQQFKKLFEKMSNIIMDKYGINKMEIEILLFLKANPSGTARDIAEHKFFSKAYISQAIEHLSERGYLTGKPDAQDRRCIHLILNEEAQPLCEELAEVRKQMIAIIYKDLTMEEKQLLTKVADKIAHNINEELVREI